MNGEKWRTTKKTKCFGFIFFAVLLVATTQGTPTTLKDAMMHGDLIEKDVELSRLVQS